MYNLFIQPLLLGLSTGLYCFAHCFPFVGSYLVAEKRKSVENFKVILQIIAGRFIGYLLFGAFFGYLGEKISHPTINLILIISLIGLSLLLILHALGLLKSDWACQLRKKFGSESPKFGRFAPKFPKVPLLMGFLLGIHLCPPFLISLTYVLTLGHLVKGLIYFTMFFLGTSLYFLPMTFLGFLNKMKEFRFMARLAALIVGCGFLVYGFYSLFFE